jgi:3-oxoacyl-[acyl-carrier protein] reductase
MNGSLPAPKTALITSAGRAPARDLALALAGLGWNLALNDLTPQRLDETAAAAQALGGLASAHIGDPSKGLFARGLVEEVLDRWQEIDLLVNCPLASPRLPLLELDEWDFQRTLEANVHGPFLLMQLAGNRMRSEGRPGMILNLITSPTDPPSQAGREAFYASQMALMALTAAAAPALLMYNIDIYGVCVGENGTGALVNQVKQLLDPDRNTPAGIILHV